MTTGLPGITHGARRPRVGCLGVGWIGRMRLAALAATGLVDLVAVADPDPGAGRAARELLPAVALCDGLDELLDRSVDGIVIATPSALHASQAIAALDTGAAVFCQKPLARTAEEARTVLEAARSADRLLAVDLSYRHTRAAQALRAAVAAGELGSVHAVELVFHNGYGPDKPWFTTRSQAGGGCLIDLGTHLLDLALWLTGATGAAVDAAHLSHRGGPVDPAGEQVEDFALVQLRTDSGIVARIACSWFLPVGCDCLFQVTAYGTDGAVTMRNVGGSFYDFVAERHQGTRTERVVEGPDDWGGRAIVDWGRRLATGAGFDATADELAVLATVIDEIYEASACAC